MQNVYNVNDSSRYFLLKFSIPDSKKVLLIDCGNRVHLTDYERSPAPVPSTFIAKLRKHLNGKRLSGIKQVGADRVLVLEFGDGLFYLVLEFFSAGNIILLDSNRKIMTLQRVVAERERNDKYAVNETYKMFDETLFKEDSFYQQKEYNTELISGWLQDHKNNIENMATDNSKNRKSKVFSIHKLVFLNNSHISSDLLQNCFCRNNVNPSTICFDFLDDEEKRSAVLKVLQDAEKEYTSIISQASHYITGFIVMKKNPYFDDFSELNESTKYISDQYHPFKPIKAETEDYQVIGVSGYNKTLDKFYSEVESNKHALGVEHQKQVAQKRLEQARQDRDKQIESLVGQRDTNVKKGNAIIEHASFVDSCKEYVLDMLRKRMDWSNIESFIKLEKHRGNRIAKLINLPLNLKENKISLTFTDIDHNESEDDYHDSSEESVSDSEELKSDSDLSLSSASSEDLMYLRRGQVNGSKKVQKKSDENDKSFSVWIDLSLSPYANSGLYFDNKKSAEVKQLKVEEKTQLALRNAERKVNQDLKTKLKDKSEGLKHFQPKLWFEKFFWFVSSEGYLCLAGRDNSQNDMIYYRYFNDNDCFISSDVDGSLCVFVKNPVHDATVPPATLMQAGIFAISASHAWDKKITTSAWVLNGSDVSKRDFDGSIVPSGLFNFKASKNYLPPVQLVMGIGLYWLSDEDTTTRYRETRIRWEEDHGVKIITHNKKQDLELLANDFKNHPFLDERKDIQDHKLETRREEERSPNIGDRVSQPENSPRPEEESDATLPVEVPQKIAESVESKLDSLKGRNTKNERREQKPARGKRSKQKKIAQKYGSQDEEERRLKLEALGVWKQIEGENKKNQTNLEPKQDKQQQQKRSLAQKRKIQEEKEVRKYLAQNHEDEESSANNYLDVLDSLVSRPRQLDNFVGVIPVFAPWQALLKFKYKIKIQPGNDKKTKAFSECLRQFEKRKVDATKTDIEEDWPIEHELLKQLNVQDYVGIFTANKLKAALSGADKKSTKLTQKKGKK